MADFRERLPYDSDEANKLMLEGHQAQIWTALPGIITKYNAVAITVEVQPTIQGTQRKLDGTTAPVTLPILVDVPVCFPRGGGYTLTFPIQENDECLVVFSSRCIDGWWQSGQVAPQGEPRMHDLSDGFAIVGPFSQKQVIGAVSTISTQLRSDDGTMFVDLNSATGAISVEAPAQINLTAPVVNIVASSQVTIQTPTTTTTGNVQVDGTAHVDGKITSDSDIVGANISLDNHIHSTGNSDTGPPVAGS